MEIESEVFGSCVGKINVSVEVEISGVWLCCGWKYMRLNFAGKATQYLQLMWKIVPGIGSRFRRFEIDDELKSPCGGAGLDALGCRNHYNKETGITNNHNIDSLQQRRYQ